MRSYQVRGTTDEITTCQICGKPELRGTVILAILDADGSTEDVTYAGSTCAAKLAGGRTTSKNIRDAAAGADRKRADAVKHSAGMVAYYEPFEPSPALLAAKYETANAGYFRNYPDASPLDMARDCLARHREIIATNGLAAISR